MLGDMDHDSTSLLNDSDGAFVGSGVPRQPNSKDAADTLTQFAFRLQGATAEPLHGISALVMPWCLTHAQRTMQERRQRADVPRAARARVGVSHCRQGQVGVVVGGSRPSINSSMKFTIRLTDMYQRWVRPLLKRHFLRASASDWAWKGRKQEEVRWWRRCRSHLLLLCSLPRIATTCRLVQEAAMRTSLCICL